MAVETTKMCRILWGVVDGGMGVHSTRVVVMELPIGTTPDEQKLLPGKF